MNNDLLLCRMREAREKWAEGDAETNTPLMVSLLRMSSSEVEALTWGNFRSISMAFHSDVTQIYFSGTPRQ